MQPNRPRIVKMTQTVMTASSVQPAPVLSRLPKVKFVLETISPTVIQVFSVWLNLCVQL